MPELPEVETVRRGLEQYAKGAVITAVDIDWARSFPASPEDTKALVIGSALTEFNRRGKVLIIDLGNDHSLMIHLKMTGQLILQNLNGKRIGGGHPTKSMQGELPDTSTRVVFNLNDGRKLFFNDQRKFGWIRLVQNEHIYDDSLLQKMGPEPFGDEFTFDEFVAKLKRRSAPIKPVLLDQTVVAGLGNIYVDEALFLTKIHPRTPANQIDKARLEELFAAIPRVMQDSLDRGGTSFTHFVDANGFYGDYLKHAWVFKREGQPCRRCEAPIEKFQLGGRGTHVCPECQVL